MGKYLYSTQILRQHSQKNLLEVSALDVELQDMETAEDSLIFDTQDIVIIDLDRDKSRAFFVRDSILRARQCPKFFVTIFDNQTFQSSNRLGQGEFQILFKPYSPKDMIAAVERVSLS